MKRYDLSSECLCGVGFEPLCEESPEGYWVDVDIAQLLYDTLVNVLNEMEHNPILEEEIEQALVRADLGYNY